ncbi:hypothetical protein HME9304_00170 [Flagellimonas maritima]|uniref:Putative beta-lactamase-inhibitor-like PepSY-like domain-containing protein n=1 Tax=Flagellimonas maritima TaxID=1383885 RepID=A0A2Z4LN09_9FLAO|nr:PepSY-like domain-containing protein [Allomuricauda aurantiaca]AWX43183.1 hypothetical protein HME9304_00170 [Allomuricauda aurantiaca]
MLHIKNNFFVLSTYILLTCSCISETKGQAPQEVKSTFIDMYPNENDPDWHLDKNGNYESHFKIDGISYRADFTPEGKWIETESSIDKKDVPKAIKEAIEDNYKDLKIVEIEKVQHHSKGTFYDVEFKKDGSKVDIEFNSKGEIIN